MLEPKNERSQNLKWQMLSLLAVGSLAIQTITTVTTNSYVCHINHNIGLLDSFHLSCLFSNVYFCFLRVVCFPSPSILHVSSFIFVFIYLFLSHPFIFHSGCWLTRCSVSSDSVSRVGVHDWRHKLHVIGWSPQLSSRDKRTMNNARVLCCSCSFRCDGVLTIILSCLFTYLYLCLRKFQKLRYLS